MRCVCAALLTMSLALPAAASAATTWTEADKDGYGTSTHDEQQGLAHAGRRPPDRGLLPRPRDAERAVARVRGLRRQGFAQRDTEARSRSIAAHRLAQPHLPAGERGAGPVPDHQDLRRPTRRATSLMINVRFESLTGQASSQLYALYDPALGNDDDGRRGTSRAAPCCSRATRQPGRERARRPRRASRARRAATSAPATAGGPAGLPHGLGLRGGAERQPRPDRQTALTGLSGSQSLTLALGFGDTTGRRAGRRERLARRRLRRVAHRLRARLARVPRRASRARPPSADATTLRRVGDDARRTRGQDVPRRLHRLADDAVGLGHRAREPVRRLPPRLGARPLPDRHRR